MYFSKKQSLIVCLLLLFFALSCSEQNTSTGLSDGSSQDIASSHLSTFAQDDAANYIDNENETGHANRPRMERMDYLGLTVVSAEPANNATKVLISNQITILFSENIDPNTINESSIIFDPYINGHFGCSNSVVTFTPLENLTYDTIYKVTILNSVRDLAGNRMFEDYSWQFGTMTQDGHLRGHYIGRYFVINNVSGSTMTREDSIEWTFIDYTFHADFPSISERVFCDFSGSYNYDGNLNISIAQIATQICNIDNVPEGMFSVRWIRPEDAADTLYLTQFDIPNDRKKIAVLAKQD